jgi:PIN domain nuclease of toxin-antitoxin system
VTLLLDTHVVIWVLADPRSLSNKIRRRLERGRDPVFVSAASLYEIELKRRRGRLPKLIKSGFESALEHGGYTLLPITAVDALAAAGLPDHHRDPWDRVIIAQAQARALSIATVDEEFARYGVTVVW